MNDKNDMGCPFCGADMSNLCDDAYACGTCSSQGTNPLGVGLCIDGLDIGFECLRRQLAAANGTRRREKMSIEKGVISVSVGFLTVLVAHNWLSPIGCGVVMGLMVITVWLLLDLWRPNS